MKKWTLVAQAATPDGKTISLHEHDGSYTIRMDGAALMSTRRHASEEKIAELACAHLREVRGARVLIGGLGFGFTLRAALAAVPADATVVVAELVGAVMDWNRNPALPFAAEAMADPRAIVRQQDVGEAIREGRGSFDAIILDVDNGAAALSAAANHHLYDDRGLKRTRSALRPGGCAAFWSAGPDPAFARLLTAAGFVVKVASCRSHTTSGGRHTIFLAFTTPRV